MSERVAVVLFNLGGPDSPEAVQPFLFNLFFDPAIIRLPLPLRWLLARFISKRRAPVAQEIYEHLGGKSPIVDLTRAQADDLSAALDDVGDVQCFIAMRYWHPMTLQAAEQVKAFNPDKIVLLPLYPQYSTTTTASSLKEWDRAAKFVGLKAATKAVCCYPSDPGWVRAQANLISKTFDQVKHPGQVRLLFSAHGLPKKIVDGGDPYVYQVEQTVLSVIKAMEFPVSDWAICYQSKVGRLEWVGPSLDGEIRRAAQDQVGVVIVPIAFVSEHSETLVELDIEYADMAKNLKLNEFHRVPAVGTHPDFIGGLSKIVREQLTKPDQLRCGQGSGERICPSEHRDCPLKGQKGN